MRIELNVNNTVHALDIKGHETLLEVIRDQLALTGTKTACQESECGTCTIMVDGKAILACIALAANYQGCRIVTIEGLAEGDTLHPVQQAYIDEGAVQCGFCIPGLIMSSTALLQKNTRPTQEQIEYALDGNICRCAGYPKIFAAVRAAGHIMEKK